MNLLTHGTLHLIKWLSFSKKVSKLRVLARYGVVFFSVWLIFFTLIMLTKIDASSWFICIFIDVALLAHVLFKHLLTKELKGKLAKNEIEHKYAKATAIGLIVSLPIGIISTTFGVILNDFALYNGFITASIINLVMNFISTFIMLPKGYPSKIGADSFTFSNDTDKRDPHARDNDFLDAYNTTGFNNSISPNYHNRDRDY